MCANQIISIYTRITPLRNAVHDARQALSQLGGIFSAAALRDCNI